MLVNCTGQVNASEVIALGGSVRCHEQLCLRTSGMRVQARVRVAIAPWSRISFTRRFVTSRDELSCEIVIAT
eukprot:6176331-Pleurochrysis_carterae.AAC.1